MYVEECIGLVANRECTFMIQGEEIRSGVEINKP